MAHVRHVCAKASLRDFYKYCVYDRQPYRKRTKQYAKQNAYIFADIPAKHYACDEVCGKCVFASLAVNMQNTTSSAVIAAKFKR